MSEGSEGQLVRLARAVEVARQEYQRVMERWEAARQGAEEARNMVQSVGDRLRGLEKELLTHASGKGPA